MSTEQTVGESKVWVNDVLYMAPDPVATEIERLQAQNEELRKVLIKDELLLSDYLKCRKRQELLEAALETSCTCAQLGPMTVCPACTALKT